jgi:alkanesulfonate monooxygenase SsuD/methylene tetrahydromethanopterin reductase-like flavin-dependent oxidoreductase (luciferase family)
MPLTVGLGVLSGQARPGAAATVNDEYRLMPELAVAAETAGFDGVWVSEHHGADDGYLPAVLPALAAVAAVTGRIRLGMGVALAPLQPALRFAEDCAVVDQLSGGRLTVALAAGWRRREFEWFGIPFGERVARTLDLVDICRAAWTGERFSHAGRAVSVESAVVTPTPVGRIPIWLGGTADAAVARAARFGDGYFASPRADLEIFRDRVAVFDAAAAAAGRDARRLPIAAHLDGFVSPDGLIPRHVLEGMRHIADTYAAWHAEDDGRPRPAPSDEAVARGRGIMGTPAEVAGRMVAWAAAFPGRDVHLVVRLHYPGVAPAETIETIRTFGAEVLPALRSLAGEDSRRAGPG